MISCFIRVAAVATFACGFAGHNVAIASSHPATMHAHEVAVTPESLVITGLATSQCGSASTALNRIDQATSLAAGLAAVRTAIDEVGQLVTELATELQIHSDDANLIAAYDQALADLQSARTAYTAAKQAMRDEALDGFCPVKTAQLAVWKNAATRNVPAEFRVLDLTDQQWKAVERALRAERRADRLGETLAPEHAQLLADVRSDTQVIDAQYQLASHLAAVEQVFDQFQSE